jgi:hypothetical protein
MANVPTKDSKKYFIPSGTSRPETIITEEYKDCEVRWSKIGNAVWFVLS